MTTHTRIVIPWQIEIRFQKSLLNFIELVIDR